jgi:hypothetical protein
MEQEILSHESFGQIQFARTTGKGTNFYGSELPQDNYITMRVHQSEIHRGITQDNYYPKEQILKLRMSSAQFSEMITSMNCSFGVPCTIEAIQKNKIEDLPMKENRKEFVHRKFEDRMKFFTDSIRKNQEKAKEIVKKKNLSKQDIHELNLQLEWLSQEIESNIPFLSKCFQETMDEVVFEAKLEIENAIQHKINVLGLNALHEQNNLLLI